MSDVRRQVLEEALAVVTGDRDETYGAPEESHARIAALWSAFLRMEIEPVEVAVMMILLKVARLQGTPTVDSWVDIAGYAACGAAISEELE